MNRLERAYGAIYLALAVATFKHTAWAFSTVMEGPEPKVDWANFNLDFVSVWAIVLLLVWFLWGALGAIAVDVGMYYTARAIREDKETRLPLGMWLTYGVVAAISSYAQTLYAVQHAAAFTPVPNNLAELQPGGWLNNLFTYAMVLLPLFLPGLGFIYTVFVKYEEHHRKPPVGRLDEAIGEKVYTVQEAAIETGYSEAWIRNRAYAYEKKPDKNPPFGRRNTQGKMVFTKEELDAVKRQV